jgi:glycosyltransferase involved in cell wall biosynthesis
MARHAVGDRRLVATRRVDFHVGRFSSWRRTDRIIAISGAVKEVLAADGVPATEITVVPDGIDPDEVRRAGQHDLNIRARLGLPAGVPLAVNVAALVDHKDQHTLIRAAEHARATRPDLHWVIAGEGALRGSLIAEIARLGLTDRVHLLGYVDPADALIREADVFVMSSKEEGLGSVILNALALGKPVVATAAGGIPEILPPEALVPVGDAEGLAGKVVAALSHPASRTTSFRVPFPERFTAAAMAQGVLAVYRSLV